MFNPDKQITKTIVIELKKAFTKKIGKWNFHTNKEFKIKKFENYKE